MDERNMLGSATRDLQNKQEQVVRETLGITFRQNVRVRISRPWWMPDGMFRALMRTVVVETDQVRVESSR